MTIPPHTRTHSLKQSLKQTFMHAQQAGLVKQTGKGSDKKIDTAHLPLLGLANALDAGAGAVGGLVGGWLVDAMVIHTSNNMLKHLCLFIIIITSCTRRVGGGTWCSAYTWCGRASRSSR